VETMHGAEPGPGTESKEHYDACVCEKRLGPAIRRGDRLGGVDRPSGVCPRNDHAESPGADEGDAGDGRESRVQDIWSRWRHPFKDAKTDEYVFQMPNGEFDQVVEVVLTPQGSGGFVLAKSYSCKILVIPENTYIGFQTPVVGTPASGTPIWKLARPDRFFRAQVSGQLEGTIGVGGPKGLQQVPQPPADPKTEQIVPKAFKQ
jgi:hypothetical protein